MLALYIIAGVILFIILMLSIPVDMKFDLATHEHTKVKIRIGWLFGLVWKDIRARKKKKLKEKPLKKVGGRSIKSFLPLLRIKDLPGKILKLIRQIFGCLKVRQLDADFKVGLDDPADTGIMCSVLWPALVPISLFSHMRFRVEPVFHEVVFEGSLRGRVRVFPIQMVGLVLCFILSPTGLRIVKSMMVSRWK